MISELYVENNVGRAVMDAINLFTPKHNVTAVWQHDVHPQMQRKQNGDEWWIEDIAKEEMAVLTQDRTILGLEEFGQGIVTGERQTIVDSKAHVIALGSAGYSTWDKLRCVLSHWDVVDTLLNEVGPRAVVLHLSKATVVQLP